MEVYDETCEFLNLDVNKVERLVRRLSSVGKELDRMGITVFGGSGTGTLRVSDAGYGQPYVIAHISPGTFDGGDGATDEDADGHLRGE